MVGQLRRFERKVVRKIYDPRRVAETVYQKLMNSDVQERFQGQDIVKNVKTQRLRWYGHIRRMGEEKVVSKVTEWKPDFRRTRGRLKSRWGKT